MRHPLIDNLRGGAFVLLFIAHTMPNSIWYNIRQFDVPLMVFCSGLAYADRPVSYSWSWICKRLKRLYCPILIFLSLFFLISHAFKIQDYSLLDIVASYAMVGGIGYLWIFRIFMYIMLLTPILQRISSKIVSARNLLLLTIVVLILQESLFYAIGISVPIIRITIYYAIGYSLIFLWGLIFKVLNRKGLWILAVLVCTMPLFFIYSNDVTSWTGSGDKAWYNLEHEKYPPHAYYLIYGIVCSTLAYCLAKSSLCFKKRVPILTFLGQNTCWIYLWHIVCINIVLQVPSYCEVPWQIRFIILLSSATILNYIQYQIVN